MRWLEVSKPDCGAVLVARRDLDSQEETAEPDGSVLSGDETGRAGRYARARDARRFVTGRAWMRRALGELLGVAPGRIVLATGPFGRPEIRHPASSISFSLAHCGAAALLAVSTEGRVGVDIEARDAAPDAEGLASRALAPEERDALRALPWEEREAFFLARWTAKEALLKAAGIGLSGDPARIALEPEAGGSFIGRGEPRIDGLRAWPLEAGPRFVAALATEAHQTRLLRL